jgi:hypothetical protein
MQAKEQQMNHDHDAVASPDAARFCTDDPCDGDTTYGEYFASMIRAIQDKTMVAVAGARVVAAAHVVPANDDVREEASAQRLARR